MGGYRGASGAGRVLVVVYAVLALAATGRSAVQLLSHFEVAPLAYSLSAVAAVVYIVATVALVRRGRRSHLVAWTAIVFEFVGVLVVGGLSLVHHELFPADTVWSRFGSGYFYIPLVLPIFGIAWLESQRAQARIADARHH
ncbi:hypothetical protein F8O01_08605 [Pseudoclavibacter chungangensis]|uniref:Integral membrane protein n=1 Tax=Pseudoclavibacter chungangensis TaxID=587635 RepID=A0A7J5BV32_9MICO|nr:hypothetical protein F8O01_08605 [Pseudoclavibacter chungangensis]